MIAEDAPSPNFGERRGGLRPEFIVLHHTAMATAEAALARLRDPAAEVSAHYLVAEDGRVWRLVEESHRAWHAGAGAWRDMDDMNSRSIGIELANAGPLAGFPPFPEPLMSALERLLDAIMARWRIGPAAVIGHSDMAPGRKADPGPKFDWRRLARGGRAVAPEGCGTPGWTAFSEAAAAAGYPRGGAPAELLAAVRLRLRPWARAAEPEAEDTGALLALAEAARGA